MKVFVLTSLYSFLLMGVMIWHGCSDGPDSSRTTQFEDASGEIPIRNDPGAEAPNTPSLAEKLRSAPVEDEDHSPEVMKLIEDTAKICWDSDDESNEAEKLKEVLAGFSCRVKEQISWLESPYLYAAGPSQNHACANQASSIDLKILTYYGKDEEGTGEMWLKNVCENAALEALENLNYVEENYDSGNSNLPTLDKAQRELRRIMINRGSFYNIDYGESVDSSDKLDEAVEKSFNIRQILWHSLYRINHNCAHAIDRDHFSDRILQDYTTSNNRVTPRYLYNEYYNYPDLGVDYLDLDVNININKDAARYWDIIVRTLGRDKLKFYQKPYNKKQIFIDGTGDPTLQVVGRYLTSAKWDSLESVASLLHAPPVFPEFGSIRPFEKAGGVIDEKRIRENVWAIREIDTACGDSYYKRHYTHANPERVNHFFDFSEFAIPITVPATDASDFTCLGGSNDYARYFRQHLVIPKTALQRDITPGDPSSLDDEEDDGEEVSTPRTAPVNVVRVGDSPLEKADECKVYYDGDQAYGLECYFRSAEGCLGNNDNKRYCEHGRTAKAEYHVGTSEGYTYTKETGEAYGYHASHRTTDLAHPEPINPFAGYSKGCKYNPSEPPP